MKLKKIDFEEFLLCLFVLIWLITGTIGLIFLTSPVHRLVSGSCLFIFLLLTVFALRICETIISFKKKEGYI